MSGMFCDECGYEREECPCNNPSFYSIAKIGKQIREMNAYFDGLVSGMASRFDALERRIEELEKDKS